MAQKRKPDAEIPDSQAFSAIRHPKKRAFLQALARTCSVIRAADAAKIHRTLYYFWVKQDAEFAKEFETAKAQGAEFLEAEAIRRANEGWDEPVFHQGKVVGKTRKYSDVLLIFLLKGAMPEKYREQYQISGTVKHGLEEGLAAQILARRQKRLEQKALELPLAKNGEGGEQ